MKWYEITGFNQEELRIAYCTNSLREDIIFAIDKNGTIQISMLLSKIDYLRYQMYLKLFNFLHKKNFGMRKLNGPELGSLYFSPNLQSL